MLWIIALCQIFSMFSHSVQIVIVVDSCDCVYVYELSFCVGLFIQFYNSPCNEYQAKLVLKPLSPDKKWKFIYEPLQQDVRVLSKKIPVTKYLNLQVQFLTRLFS